MRKGACLLIPRRVRWLLCVFLRVFVRFAGARLQQRGRFVLQEEASGGGAETRVCFSVCACAWRKWRWMFDLWPPLPAWIGLLDGARTEMMDDLGAVLRSNDLSPSQQRNEIKSSKLLRSCWCWGWSASSSYQQHERPSYTDQFVFEASGRIVWLNLQLSECRPK